MKTLILNMAAAAAVALAALAFLHSAAAFSTAQRTEAVSIWLGATQAQAAAEAAYAAGATAEQIAAAAKVAQ